MNIHIDPLPECKVSLRVEIPAETVRNQRETITSMFANRGKLPGFRPGKAPRKIVERKFKRDIEEELEQRLVGDGYREAVKSHKLDVLLIEEVGKAEFHPDDTVTFSATLVTVPNFELPDYKGIQVKAPQITVTDEEVDEAIKQLTQEFIDFIEVTDRGAQIGDLTEVTYKGFLEGQPLAEAKPELPARLAGGEGEWYKIEEDHFLPGFTDSLIGHRAGDEVKTQVLVPEDFPVEDARGLRIDYEITLTRVDQEKLPELTDEFVKENFAEKFGAQDVEALRTELKSRIKANKQGQRQNMLADQIVRWLDQQIDFELPTHLLFSETQRRVNDIATRAIESGMQAEKLSEHEDQIIGQASQQARINVKTSFVANRIAEAEGIEPDREEIGRAIIMMGMRQGRNPQQIMKEAAKNPSIARQVADSLRIQKTIDFLTQHANVTELTPEEIAAERAAAEAAFKARQESAAAAAAAQAGADADQNPDKP